jgi:hypothetical protein
MSGITVVVSNNGPCETLKSEDRGADGTFFRPLVAVHPHDQPGSRNPREGRSMNFGIAVLITLAVWAVVSIVVSVTVGSLADYRDSERFHFVDRVDETADEETLAS